MAVHEWISKDGDFSAAGSWSTGIAPAAWVAADKAIFTGNNAEVSAVTGLSQGAEDIALLFIGEEFLGDVGSHGNPLIINADRVVHRGKGTLHYDNSSIGAPPDTTDEIIIAHTGIKGSTAAVLTGGKMTTIAVARGKVWISDIDATSLLVLSHTGNRRGDAEVIVRKTSAVITDVMMAGGSLKMYGAADATNFFITDGTLVNESSALAASTLRLFSGTVRWNSGVTLTRAELYAGLLDFTGSTEEKTITTLFKFPEARFEYLPDLTTITTPVDMDGLTAMGG